MDPQLYPLQGEVRLPLTFGHRRIISLTCSFQLPPELSGDWLLPYSEVTVTSEGPSGTSNITIQPSLFAATSYHSQDENELNPNLSCLSQDSFIGGHYNLPSSSLSFSLPSRDSHPAEAPSGLPFDMDSDARLRYEVDRWPFDLPFGGPPSDVPPSDVPPSYVPPFDGPPFNMPPFDGPPFNIPPFDGPPFASPSVHNEQVRLL